MTSSIASPGAGRATAPTPRTSRRTSACRLGRAIRSYRGGSAFTTWLYALTLNAARDLRRKSARDSVKTEAFGVHALVSGGEACEPAPDDPAERLWAAVRTLPDKQREAVLLVYGEGLSHADAADAMALARRPRSPGTSMKRRNG